VQILQTAYGAETGVFYDASSHTLAVAGTRTTRDVATDAAFIFGAESLMTSRFDTVAAAVKQYSPHRIIGHSLGGAVASQYTGKRIGGHQVATVGYDPYILPWRGQVDRAYSDAFDPVSIFASNNEHQPLGRNGHWMPHSLNSLT